jgi:hypothetical protein
MMLHPVASYLVRFDEPRAIVAFEEPFVGLAPCDRTNPEPTIEPAQEEDALEAALAECRAAARTEFEVELAQERQKFLAEMANERNRWASEEGSRLAAEFRSALKLCVDDVNEAVTRALTPFVAREVLERLLADFVDTVLVSLSDAGVPAVELCGPADLLAVIQEGLREANVAVRLTESRSNEIAARIGFTSIETRTEEWLRRIRDEGMN